MTQAIRRGILTGFNNSTYTASVLLIEATNTALSNVPIANHIDGTSAVNNALCAVLFFDEHNYTDAVIIAMYPNGSQGVPTPPPGRLTLVSGFKQITGQTINSGVTSVFTLSGVGAIPAGTLGVLYSLTISSTVAGAFVQLGPHGATLSNYIELDISSAGSFSDISGLLPLDSNGQIDIRANIGNCSVSLTTFGYII